MHVTNPRDVPRPPNAQVRRSALIGPALLLLSGAALGGCASAPPNRAGARPAPRSEVAAARPDTQPVPASPADTLSAQEALDLAAIEAERYEGPVGSANADLDEELEKFLKEESIALLTESVDYDIPIVVNERVEYFIDYFQRRVNKSFVKWLARASQYVPYLRERFREAGLPEDLIYIALIESGFSAQATSRANAVGYWQFIAGTARRYGLRVDGWVDERRHFARSTEAAIAYLQDLHRMFGSWYLAAAAYNSGERKIQRAIERYRSENLWELSEFSYLREETKNYVPKLIAATLIAHEPEKYGFDDIPAPGPRAVDTVTVPTQTDLAVIAAAAGTTVQTIRGLNPWLRSYATPSRSPDFAVAVPAGTGDLFRERYARVPASQRLLTLYHVVRRGDNPGRIAARYGVPVRTLMAENGIRNARRLRVGQRLRIPRRLSLPEVEERVLALARPRSARTAAGRSAGVQGGPGVAGVGFSDSQPASRPEAAASSLPGAESGPATPQQQGTDTVSPRPHTLERDDNQPAVGLAAAVKDDAAAAAPPAEPRLIEASPVEIARESAQASLEGTPAVEAGEEGASSPVTTQTYAAEPADPAAGPHAAEEPYSAGEPYSDGNRYSPIELTALAVELPEGAAPAAGPPSSRPFVRPSARPAAHRVRAGETLYGIARAYGLTVAEVERWNPGLSSRLSPGMVVRLAGPGARVRSPSPASVAPRARPDEGKARGAFRYRIRPGDTLWSIALRHDVTPGEIQRWNGLRGTGIRAGERLLLYRGPAASGR